MASSDVEASSKKRKRAAEAEPHGRDGLKKRKRAKKQKGAAPTSMALNALQTKKGSTELTGHENGEASSSGWTVSKPLGGRMVNIDPILTADEKYLIIAYSASIQVYTTEDSLLLRSIRIPHGTSQQSARVSVVAAKLSPVAEKLLWVAGSDGRIWAVDWTTGAVQSKPVVTNSEAVMDIAVLTVPLGSLERELLVVAQLSRTATGMQDQMVAYNPKSDKEAPVVLVSLPDSSRRLRNMYVDPESRTIIASSVKTLLVGYLDGKEVVENLDGENSDVENLDGDNCDRPRLQSTWYQFETAEVITSLDARATLPPQEGQDRLIRPMRRARTCIDVVVGGALGAIYQYDDILNKLSRLGSSALAHGRAPTCRKLRWHQRAVHAVKWSRDGHSLISGGSERCLVLWQLDTHIKSFLPHLSASVENLVVSDTGASYVLHLDDNSAMILETATLEPMTYVSGIQSAASYEDVPPKDHWVTRAGGVDNTRRAIPAALHPQDPPRLCLCVGSGTLATAAGDCRSTPFLQTVDLELFRSISRQAVARVEPADSMVDPHGRPLPEPGVEHLAFSCDGKWLATVDVWTPTAKENLNITPDQQNVFLRQRKEVYLKFWQTGEKDEELSLITQINTPHVTTNPEDVFGLASDPTSARFATVGSDGIVRIWKPRVRKHDGIVKTAGDGRVLHKWTCAQTIVLRDQLDVADADGAERTPQQGSLAFSDDGSALFVAFGSSRDGAVYIIDATLGEVKAVLDGLWTGRLIGLRAFSRYIVLLSRTLAVYDVVADELSYALQLTRLPQNESHVETMHVEVNRATGHFAVAIPLPPESAELNVFSPEIPAPLMSRKIPARVLSLVTRPGTSGFVSLDDRAQLWTVSESDDIEALTIAQPLEDMGLNTSDEANHGDEAVVLAEDMGGASDEEAEEDGAESVDSMDVGSEDEGADPAVITREQLAEIFDAAPAFAMPPIEDVFYKVARLLAKKKPQRAAI